MNALKIVTRGIFNYSRVSACKKELSASNVRNFHWSKVINSKTKKDKVVSQSGEDAKEDNYVEKEKWAQDTISASLKERFKIFYDKDSKVILDADEISQLEKFEANDNDTQYSIYDDEEEDEFSGYNLQRGIHGVFDVEELVDVLKSERIKDVCVIKIPPEFHYTDYLVLVTAISTRQMKAIVEFLLRLHKKKKSVEDPFLLVGGKTSTDWKVLDLGNIILHIFLEETRQKYDIETLWTVGRDYDELSKKTPNDLLDLIELHTFDIDQMHPRVAVNQNINNK